MWFLWKWSTNLEWSHSCLLLLVSYWTQLGSSASTNTIDFSIKPSLNPDPDPWTLFFPLRGGWVGKFGPFFSNFCFKLWSLTKMKDEYFIRPWLHLNCQICNLLTTYIMMMMNIFLDCKQRLLYIWIYSRRVVSIRSDPYQALKIFYTKQTNKNYRKWKWKIPKLEFNNQKFQF